MLQNKENAPIGIFDSGLGGLTVMSAIKKVLPNENIIYFGDTAHLPYGDKSKESIARYSLGITEFLIQLNCKVVVIACNTASSLAFDDVRKVAEGKAIVINVIDPVIEYVKENNSKNIGVIGTKATTNSQSYPKKLKIARPDITVMSLATPMFVPMIEEGFIYDDISNAIIRAYLSDDRFKTIDSLILGCTHYPLIKNQIRKFFDFSVKVIDSSETTASEVKKTLQKYSLANNNSIPGRSHYFVSDYTEMFDKISRIFFDDEINLRRLDLWHLTKEEKLLIENNLLLQ